MQHRTRPCTKRKDGAPAVPEREGKTQKGRATRLKPGDRPVYPRLLQVGLSHPPYIHPTLSSVIVSAVVSASERKPKNPYPHRHGRLPHPCRVLGGRACPELAEGVGRLTPFSELAKSKSPPCLSTERRDKDGATARMIARKAGPAPY